MPETVTIKGITLRNVHDENADCLLFGCIVHNPTVNMMMDWPLYWRGDRGIFERICAHGIGHPDYDQAMYFRRTDQGYQNVHGCDGCCDYTIRSENG
jgi:hypothetical protein